MTTIIIMCLIAAVVALGARLVSLEHRVDNLDGGGNAGTPATTKFVGKP